MVCCATSAMKLRSRRGGTGNWVRAASRTRSRAAAIEIGEGAALLRAAERVEPGQPVAVDVAQAGERSAELGVERRDQRPVRGGQTVAAVELPAPVHALQPRRRHEALEVVARPPRTRHALVVVDEGLAAAERTAGMDGGHARVERGEQALDVAHGTERHRTRVGVARQDAVGERLRGRAVPLP